MRANTPNSASMLRIRRVPLAGIGVLAAIAIGLHALLQSRETERLGDAATAAVAEALSAPLMADRPFAAIELDGIVRSIVNHPFVVAAAVLDGSGRVRATAAADEGMGTILAASDPAASADAPAQPGTLVVELPDSPFRRASVLFGAGPDPE